MMRTSFQGQRPQLVTSSCCNLTEVEMENNLQLKRREWYVAMNAKLASFLIYDKQLLKNQNCLCCLNAFAMSRLALNQLLQGPYLFEVLIMIIVSATYMGREGPISIQRDNQLRQMTWETLFISLSEWNTVTLHWYSIELFVSMALQLKYLKRLHIADREINNVQSGALSRDQDCALRG